MTTVVLLALLISAVVYLLVGFAAGRYNKSLADLFPIILGKNARVNTVDEFATSTVATTVSLATIVLAYFELAGYFGLYLLWTAVTTAIGMVLVSYASTRIWEKINAYDHRPSLHEFLGVEFDSKAVVLVASACTSIGFLLIFATELIVGSRFLARLIPTIPEWITVVFLSGVGLVYTLVGGFRAVIKTDQIQMKMIWGLIIVLGGYYAYHILTGNQSTTASNMSAVFDFSPRAGLGFFLLGVAIMNIPTHISNMSVWQRISGAQQPETVMKGFKQSIWSISLSWGVLAVLACMTYLIVTPQSNQTLLTDLLIVISSSPIGKVVLFFVVLGLYGAMLSTASTNLIVVAHSISEDILAKFKTTTLVERIQSKKEFLSSRIILLASALVAVLLVEGLKYFGFSIADLVFAIYGGALALFPPILFALYSRREQLTKLSKFANAAVILGFTFGWGAAIYGKIIGNANLVFLSPGFSIATSFLILILGLITKKNPYSSRTQSTFQGPI
jgi:Na+/proline symporter